MLAEIGQYAAHGKIALVNNVNVHACNLAYEQPVFHSILNASEIVFCDGFGVKLGAWMMGKKLGQRMTPPDWIDELFLLCAEKGYSVFFVGDTKEVVERFAGQVQQRHPELKIAGWHHGFFECHGSESDGVVDMVSDSGADIIITGMGMPRQELWAWEAKSKVNKGVFIATGALFRWYTGIEQRAQKWVTDCGLEWLARLVTHPRTLFQRYVVGIPLFFFRIVFGRRNG
ncbi:WecB/TagA/CpsF family glycosyltransferase [Pontiella sulfatireligans]|uniref:WecB/TagA/CpsF family glycosyltransferase n=1 Tax=Pontiella sulfatireligans TaxID=2750658 RepID=UPI00144445CC|nr:WecB/TagA/CpsF family glycosyltransferase [Pontiella sulfatireligans]